MITLTDILQARRRIAPFVRRTPLARSAWLSERAGAEVYLKLESLQVTGAYKVRGAVNAALCSKAQSLVTASAGNHGRALALAARQLGRALTVLVPQSAPRVKVDAMRALGATVELAATYDEAERLAKAHAAATGRAYVSPYNDPEVIAGAGTVGLEIFEDLPDVDVLVVPVGGGGLISGVASAARAIGPASRVIGVEVEASHPFHASLAAGRIVTIDVGPTLADGLAGNLDPDSITFAIVQRTVDEMVMVTEGQLASAIRGLAMHEHLIVEGAGAVGVAALLGSGGTGLSGLLGRVQGRAVAIVVSGGNIDLDAFLEAASRAT